MVASREGRADSTIASYKRDLKKFLDWVTQDSLSIQTLEESDIIRFLRHLQKSVILNRQ